MDKGKVVIFGTGKSAKIVEENLNSNIKIVSYIDNNKKKQGTTYNNILINSPIFLKFSVWDYIIIGSIHYEEIEEQLISLGIEMNRVVSFFSYKILNMQLNREIFISEWKINAVHYKIKHIEQHWNKTISLLMNNVEYEIADKINKNMYTFPKIISGEVALNKIINESFSMSRFGDGEFELMAMKHRPKFQQPNEKLAQRLKEVLKSNLENHIVGLADNYGSLDQYSVDSAMAIREYMSDEVRKYHMSVLDIEKTYYDAYITRPYIIYKNKNRTQHIFELFKKVWDKRDVIIVEGNKTKIGVGNDLLSNTSSVKRIIAPSENAYNVYDKIFSSVCNHYNPYNIILIALGPTATVLAYDLAKKGFQAIDIGHIDIEYEWYLKGCKNRINILNKYVNEVPSGENTYDIFDEKYENEIIIRIS